MQSERKQMRKFFKTRSWGNEMKKLLTGNTEFSLKLFTTWFFFFDVVEKFKFQLILFSVCMSEKSNRFHTRFLNNEGYLNHQCPKIQMHLILLIYCSSFNMATQVKLKLLISNSQIINSNHALIIHKQNIFVFFFFNFNF